MNPLADLRAAVEAAAARVRGEGRAEGAAPTLERPPKVEFHGLASEPIAAST